MSTTTRRNYRVAMAVAIVASLSCSGDSLNDGHPTSISGKVVWAGPVAGARVEARQITVGGELYNNEIIASTTTGEDGSYTLPLGIQGNIIEVRAFGGRTTDVYTGTSLTLDDAVELRAYHQHIQLDQLVTGATVSPITTLQADLADARRIAKRPDSLDGDSSIDRARALLGSHLLDIAAETTTPADVSSPTAVPAPSPTVEYRYGLVLAGMSVYSAQIAQASGLTVQDFNITHLYRGLAADIASDPDVVFDGHTTSGFARVGACPLKQNCPAGTDFDAKPECRTACDLFANSPRAYLARAILAWLGDARNKSGISPEDLRSRLEQMAGNTEPNLFGPTLPEALLTDGPAITFDSPNGTVMGLVDIKVTAVSPVGVQTLTVGWDSTTPGPALVDANPDPAVFEVHGFDTTQLGDAEWTLTATAIDALGHTTDGAKHSFVIDNIGSGTLSGVAWKGPITGATVRAFRFAGGVRGALLGTGTTNASGVFSNITLAQGYSGPVEVAVGQTGTYTEESSPVQVTVDVDNELRTVIPNYTDGQAVGQVVVTPITSFAAAYLDWKVAQAGATANIPTLWQEAVAVMQAQFDIPDIEHLTPIAPASIVTLSGGARYSLALVGLSQRALQVSSNRPAGSGDAGSFPSVMNSLVVTAKLEADLRSDGCWNAKAGAVELFYGGTAKLSKDDTRIGLASAIVGYVTGPENQTPFANAGDLLGLLDTLSNGGPTTGAGGCSGGGIYPDAGSNFDQVGPIVVFSAEPGDLHALDPVVRGTIHLVATGNDQGIDPKPSTVITHQLPNMTYETLPDTDGDTSDADAHATIDTVALGDGPVNLRGESTDDSTNVGTGQHSFIADNTPPVLSVTGVQNGDTYADNRVIAFTQADTNPGTTTATLNNVAFTSGAQVTADGDYTLVVNGSDQASNAAAPVSLTFHINRLGPVITITGVAASQYYNTTRTITFAQNGTGGTISATLNGLPFTSGSMVTLDNEYDLVVNATNAAGLTSTSSVHFTIDSVAPVITFTGVANNGAYNANVFVTFDQNDLHKGTTTALLNNAAIITGTTVSTENDYTLKLTATDLAGNIGTPVTILFVVDKTAPTIAVTGVTNNQYYNGNVTIGFTAATEPHLSSITATLNGTPFTSGMVVSLDSHYTLVVTATDTAGNQSTTTIGFTIDTMPPTITVGGLPNGVVSNGVYSTTRFLTYTMVDANAGPLSGTLTTLASNVTTPGGPVPITTGYGVTVVDGEESKYRLAVTGSDLAGNVATPASITFSMDRKAPTVTFAGVANGAFYNGDKVITFGQSDANPGTTTATLNGVAFTSGSSTSTAANSDVTYTLHIVATDAAGFTGTPVDVVFHVDRKPPIVDFPGLAGNVNFYHDVANDQWWAKLDTSTFTGDVTEANLQKVELWVDGPDAGNVAEAYPGTAGSGTFQVTLPTGILKAAPGFNLVEIRATDLAGNTGSWNGTFLVDAGTPVVGGLAASMYDETKDSIVAGAASAPQHSHTGALVSLGQVASCTTSGATQQVFKYTYLMRPTLPAGITEAPAARNPIRWTFDATDLNGAGITAAEYEVHRQGQAPGTWRSAGTAVGTKYTIDLDRDTWPELAQFEDVFLVNVRAVDRFGRYATVASTCWGHHPLGPWLNIGTGTAVPASDTAFNPLAAATLSGPDNDAKVAELINGTSAGAGIMKVTVTNGTDEDAYVELALPANTPATPQFEVDYMTTNAPIAAPTTRSCGCTASVPNHGNCNLNTLPASSGTDNPLANMTTAELHQTIRVFKANNTLDTPGATGRYLVPKRTNATAPTTHTIVIATTSLPRLQPVGVVLPIVATNLVWRNGAATVTTPITGKLGTTFTWCTATSQATTTDCAGAGNKEVTCTADVKFQTFTAVTRTRMQFTNSQMQLNGKTAATPDASAHTWVDASVVPYSPFILNYTGWNTTEDTSSSRLPSCTPSAPNCPPP